MANSDASSATVRVLVLFDLLATDDTSSSSARPFAIHKEIFNVLLSSHENNDLFNFVKHLKAVTGLAQIPKSKGLEENPEVTITMSCSFIVLKYKKLFFLQESWKAHVNSKYQSKGLVYILCLLAPVQIRLFSVFFWVRKMGFGINSDEKSAGCGILMKKGREFGIRTPSPFQTLYQV